MCDYIFLQDGCNYWYSALYLYSIC